MKQVCKDDFVEYVFNKAANAEWINYYEIGRLRTHDGVILTFIYYCGSELLGWTVTKPINEHTEVKDVIDKYIIPDSISVSGNVSKEDLEDFIQKNPMYSAALSV